MIYYLHSRFGLSGNALTLVTVPALLISAMLDVAMGRVLCRISPRQILVMQAIGAGATGVGVVALLAIHPGDNATLLLTMVGFRVAYTLYDVMQNALTSLFPANEADAHRYVMLRAMLSSVARLAVASAAMLLVGDAAPLAGWEAMVMLPVAILVITSALAITRLSLPIAAIKSEPLPTISAMSRGIAPLLAAAMFHAAALSMPARFIPFIANAQSLLFVFVAGTLAGPIAANMLVGTIGRARAIIVLTTLTIAGLAGLAIPGQPLVEATGIAIHGIGVGGTGMLLWSDMSRIVRRHASRTGERGDLLAFALLTGAIKIGIAASAATIAWLVDAGTEVHQIQVVMGITVMGGVAYVVAMRSRTWSVHPDRGLAPA